MPIGPEYGSTLSLPDPSQYEACLAVVDDDDSGWQLALSDGVEFHVIGKQCAAQPDSSSETVTDLRAEFNAFLAKLRDSGLMATS